MKKIILIFVLPFLLLGNNAISLNDKIALLEKNEKEFLSMLQSEHIRILEREEMLRLEKEKIEKIRIEKIRQEKINYALKHETSLLASRLKSLMKSHLGYLSVLVQKEKIYKEKQLRIDKQREKRILAKIDIATQRMYVYKGDTLLYTWKVSSGKRGHATPRGQYRALSTVKNYMSRKYKAPMPYSVFFKPGYAIHATNSINKLGSPASHGCIRLHKSNASKFYALVRKMGKKNTTISIIN
ncbi:MAG: L,D-transpeptidase [Sulfurovum sp.]|nr:L,D-transpeptidase [Sulfurovum sp.]